MEGQEMTIEVWFDADGRRCYTGAMSPVLNGNT
jgi:hypothetical protein